MWRLYAFFSPRRLCYGALLIVSLAALVRWGWPDAVPLIQELALAPTTPRPNTLQPLPFPPPPTPTTETAPTPEPNSTHFTLCIARDGSHVISNSTQTESCDVQHE